MKVFKISETKIEYGLIAKILESGCGINCNKILDKSGLEPTSSASFLKILDNFHPSDFNAEHCMISFLIVCSFDEFESLQTLTGTSMFCVESKNSMTVILSKTALAWKTFVEASNKISSIKKLSNEIQTLLERGMLSDLFSSNRKRHNPDGTFDLVRM